jgi:hypothetical protein
MKLKSKAIKNRDKLLNHIMDKFPFEGTGAAGVYFDKELNAKMTVAGNEVSIDFRKKEKRASS